MYGLKESFQDLWAPGSGHVYCTLKDDASQIRGVIFRATAMRLRFALADGLSCGGEGKSYRL